jgi:hypothetical protein
MKKLLITAAISLMSMSFNAEAQSNKPKTMREMYEAKLVASLPTQNDDTATVMPPQTDYTFLISLLPTVNNDNDFENEAKQTATVVATAKPENKQTSKIVTTHNTDLR